MNIGIIGAGNIATKMARTINKMDGFSNYAIASRSLDKAEKFKRKFKFEKAFGSYEEMLNDPNVEMVYIATPHSCHYSQMLLCLKHKKPVLCEKILTTSLANTTDIYKKFEEENVFLCEALWTSFMPSRTIINDLIYKDKTIGNIISMNASFKVPLMNKERVAKKELGGGVLQDIGIYPITFIFRTLGFNYNDYTIKDIKYKKDVDKYEVIEFNYNNVKATAKVDGRLLISLLVKIKGDKGFIITDTVNCPNFILLFNKYGILKKFINCRPKFGGFEFELEACKKAIKNGLLECEEWSHKNSIEMAKIEDALLNQQ